MSQQNTLLPIAIVIAGAMVSAGLYFGLRARGPEVVPQAPSSPSQSAAATAATQGTAPEAPAPPPPAPRPDEKKVARDAIAALEAQRAALGKACWEPFAREKPSPPHIDYVVDVTFDLAGKQVMRGLSEDRKTARADVTACVSGRLAPLQVPPPGAVVRVEIPFRLP